MTRKTFCFIYTLKISELCSRLGNERPLSTEFLKRPLWFRYQTRLWNYLKRHNFGYLRSGCILKICFRDRKYNCRKILLWKSLNLRQSPFIFGKLWVSNWELELIPRLPTTTCVLLNSRRQKTSGHWTFFKSVSPVHIKMSLSAIHIVRPNLFKLANHSMLC